MNSINKEYFKFKLIFIFSHVMFLTFISLILYPFINPDNLIYYLSLILIMDFMFALFKDFVSPSNIVLIIFLNIFWLKNLKYYNAELKKPIIISLINSEEFIYKYIKINKYIK